MSSFGLLLAGGSLAFFVAVYVAGTWADEPSEALVISGLLVGVVGIISGLTLAIAGVFI